MNKIPFLKQFANAHDLILLLQSRGLIIEDPAKAERYLEFIGYYRLSAYMYPLLQIPKAGHQYKPNTTFSHVMMLYRFDKKLPMLPNKVTGQWITLPTDTLRIYFNLCIIKYFVDILSPQNDMKAKIDSLLNCFPDIDIRAMGFPQGWDNEPLWR